MDFDDSLRQAMRTGRVELGLDTTIRSAMTGRARLIIVSDKVPPERLADLQHYTKLSGVPIVRFDGSGADLGRVCRKPFQVSSVAVIDPGDSNIMAAAKGD